MVPRIQPTAPTAPAAIARTAVVAVLVVSTAVVEAQSLPPDDPAIADGLVLWLRDAANTFDPESGIWVDGSGRGHDAETVGQVETLDYLAPTLVETGGGAFSGEPVSAVQFASAVDDLMGTPSLNEGVGLDRLTIIAVHNVWNLGGTTSLTRPVGFGSISATLVNPGDQFNFGCDPSIRKDNGNVGAGQYLEPFPVDTLFIRSARMTPDAIDEWFNLDGSTNNVLSVVGSSFTTSIDQFYLGDLRCGINAVPGFGTATAPSDFDIVEVVVYRTALTDEQIQGVNTWLAENLGTPSGSGGGFRITEVTFDPVAGEVTLTWASKPGRLYTVQASGDLSFWEELDDAVESGGPETTFTDTSIPPDATRRYYRILEP